MDFGRNNCVMDAGVNSADEKGNTNLSVRRTSIARLSSDDFKWLYDRVREIVTFANQSYSYDLGNAAMEQMQLAAYSAKNRGTFGWHMDMGDGAMTRKLGVSVPLNSDSEYEGGELQFNYGQKESIPQIAGQAIVFPSYAMHRVTPVTKGVRYSLVAWIHGAPFR